MGDTYLENIYEDIRDQANLEIEQIKREMTLMHDEQLNTFAVGLEKETSLFMANELKELQLKAITNRSKSKQSLKKALLAHRQKLAHELFDNLLKKLNDFTSTSEYQKYLLDKLTSVPQATKIYIRKVDEKLYGDLSAYKVEYAKKIKIGGFRLLDEKRGYEYDFTLDSAFDAQKEFFIHHSLLVL